MKNLKTTHKRQSAQQYLEKLSKVNKLGRFEELAELCEAAPKDLKSNPEVLAYLARAQINRGKPWSALPFYKKAASKNLNSILFLNNFTSLYLQLGRPDEAVTWARKSFALGPKNLKSQAILIECLIALGKTGDAKKVVNACVDSEGANRQSLLALARIQYFDGSFEDAASTCRTLIKSGFGAGQVYLSLFQSLDLRATVPEKGFVKSMCERKDIPPNDRRQYLRAMALFHDSNGDFDEAFQNYKLIADSQHVHNGEQPLRKKLDRLKNTITPEFIDKYSKFGNSSAKPIFVVGMPRSGTSLTEQILSSHPEISGAGELDYFRVEEFRLSGKNLSSNDLRSSAKEYLKLLDSYSDGAKHVVDKMPGNFERLWLLALEFPNATFIHCRRNALANCVSCYTSPLSVRRHGYASNLESLGRQYRLYTELMNYWERVLPTNILTVDYEELVSEPEKNIRKIIRHVGVDWSDDCLNFHNNQRAVKTPSRKQVSASISTDAITKWKRFESHLVPLKQALLGPVAL